MKKLIKEHSPYLLFLCLAEIIITIVSIEAFVYSDSLTYSDSLIYTAIGIESLLESLYSSTFWAFILFTLGFITITSITSILFKKIEFLFMSILGWVLMLLLAINIGNPIKDILFVILLFIPIILINIIAYKTEKQRLEKGNKTTKSRK